jgi:hypothetical protein
MSQLPDSASFEEQVQDCFLAYRGKGLSLSALDEELLTTWAQAQVPFEIIARGIRKAAEAALWDRTQDDERIRSLTACRKSVEAEMQKFLRRSIGQHEATPAPAEEVAPAEDIHVTRHKKLKAAIRKFAREEGPQAARLSGWVERLPLPSTLAQAQRQEELAVAHTLRMLPGPARAELLREASRLMQKANRMSPKARRESRRFHRAALLRRQCNFPSFW